METKSKLIIFRLIGVRLSISTLTHIFMYVPTELTNISTSILAKKGNLVYEYNDFIAVLLKSVLHYNF